MSEITYITLQTSFKSSQPETDDVYINMISNWWFTEMCDEKSEMSRPRSCLSYCRDDHILWTLWLLLLNQNAVCDWVLANTDDDDDDVYIDIVCNCSLNKCHLCDGQVSVKLVFLSLTQLMHWLYVISTMNWLPYCRCVVCRGNVRLIISRY